MRAGKVATMATNRRAHLFITEHLLAAGLSDQQAATKLGVNRETVWRWQEEQHRLDPQKILQIADVCGVEPGDLWRMPGFRSIDKMLNGAPEDIQELAVDLVERLLQKKSTS